MHPDQRINGRPRAAAPRLQRRRSCRLSTTLRSSGKNSKTLPHWTFRHFHLFRRIFRKHRHRLPDTQVHNCRQNPGFPTTRIPLCKSSFPRKCSNIPPLFPEKHSNFSIPSMSPDHPRSVQQGHSTTPPLRPQTYAPHAHSHRRHLNPD